MFGKLKQPAGLTFPPMKVGIILHGQKRESEEIRRRLSALADLDLEIRITAGPGDTREIARSWMPLKDVVIGCGGDGTLHELVNGLMAASAEHPDKRMPVAGLLPLGTGNDYARMMGWPRGDVRNLIHRLRKMETLAVDLGVIRTSDRPPLWFINAADAGLGAYVVTIVERMKPRWPRRLVFPAAIIRGLLSYRRTTLECTADDRHFTGESLTTVVALGSSFADGIVIAPDGGMNNGEFQVVRIGRVSIAEYIRFLPQLKQGRKIKHPEIHYFTARNVQLSGSSALEADGELAGVLPCTLEVVPSAIRILR